VAAFRANYTKLALKLAKRLPERERILAAIGESSLREIAQAGVLSWLPEVHHARLLDALIKVVGPAGARVFWRDLMLSSFERSLLRPLVEGGLRLFGRTPRAILKLSSRAYSLIARDCGTIENEDVPNGIRLHFQDLPPLLRSTGFVELCHGNCLSVPVFLGQIARVQPDVSDLSVGTLRIEVRS